ncbi:hypothetical protein NN561_020333 [Cricetulus griseus]
MEGTQRGTECEMHRFGNTGAPPWTTGQWGSWLGWEHLPCVTSARFGGDSRVAPVDASCVFQEAGENPAQAATGAQSVPSLSEANWTPARVSETTPGVVSRLLLSWALSL